MRTRGLVAIGGTTFCVTADRVLTALAGRRGVDSGASPIPQLRREMSFLYPVNRSTLGVEVLHLPEMVIFLPNRRDKEPGLR